jgi:hypothetical protein
MESNTSNVLMDGRMMSANELQMYAKQHGLCTNCGAKTHTKVGGFMRKTWEPETNFSVYKGYCLQPTCYTLDQAQELLGERKKKKKKRVTKARGSEKTLRRPSGGGASTMSLFDEPSTLPSTNLPQTTEELVPSVEVGGRNSFASAPTLKMNNTSKNNSTQQKSPTSVCVKMVPSSIPQRNCRAQHTESLPNVVVIDNVREIFKALSERGDDSYVASLALNNLHNAIVRDKRRDFNEGDLEIVWLKMRSFMEEPRILHQAISLLNVMINQDPTVRGVHERCRPLQLLLEIMRAHPSQDMLQRQCCKLLESVVELTKTFEDEIGLELVQALRCRLSTRSKRAEIAASCVRALYHMARSPSGAALWQRNILATRELIEIACKETPEILVREGAFFLVALQVRVLNVSNFNGGRPLADEKQVDAIVRILHSCDSAEMYGNALEIVGHSYSDVGYIPQDTATCLRCVQASLSGMQKFPNFQSVQVAATCTISNIVDARDEGPLVAILHTGSATTYMQEAMRRYPNNAHLAKHAWRVFAFLCETGDNSMLTINMLRSFQTQALSPLADKDVRIEVSEEFNQICKQASDKKILHAAALLVEVDKSAREETDPFVLVALFGVFLTLLKAAIDDDTEQERTQVARHYRAGILERIFQVVDVNDDTVLRARYFRMLADLYTGVPFQGKLHQTSNFFVGRVQVSLIIYTPTEIKTISRIMRNNEGDMSVQEACCASLSRFSTVCWDLQRSESLGREVVNLANEILSDVVDTMMNSASSEGVQSKTLLIYWMMTFICDNSVLERINPTFVSLALNAIENHSTNNGIRLIVCSFFSALASKEYNRELLASSRTIALLLSMVQCDNKAVVARSSQTLALIVNQNEQAVEALGANSDAVCAALILALETHSECLEIQRCVCSFVEVVVCSDKNAEPRNQLTNCGGLKALLEIFDLHRVDQQLRWSAVKALAAMIVATEADVLFANRFNLSEVLFFCFVEMSLNDIVAAATILHAIHFLCSKDEFFRRAVALTIPSLQVWMVRYFSDCDVQLQGCHLILKAVTSDNELSLVAEGRGALIEFLCNLLLAHAESRELVECILNILRILGAQSVLKRVFENCEADEVIVSTMHTHSHHPNILANAFATLNNIAVNVEERTIYPLKDSALQAVIDAMTRYQSENNVQANALILFKSYTLDHDSLSKMKKASEKLVPLLFSAAENFTQDCEARAEYILRRLRT